LVSGATTSVTDAGERKMQKTPQADIPLPPKTSMMDFSVSSRPTATLASSSKPSKAIVPTSSYMFSPKTNSVEFSTWVLVYGIPVQDPMYYQALVSRFASYGVIQSRFPSSYGDSSSIQCTSSSSSDTTPTLASSTHFPAMMMNWIFLRYETALQAEDFNLGSFLSRSHEFLLAQDNLSDDSLEFRLVDTGLEPTYHITKRFEIILVTHQFHGVDKSGGYSNIGKCNLIIDKVGPK
jgi:hypothetical protein